MNPPETTRLRFREMEDSDLGLTWQEVNGIPSLEVGYHVRADLQGQGYASEAAAACRDYAVFGVDIAPA